MSTVRGDPTQLPVTIADGRQHVCPEGIVLLVVAVVVIVTVIVNVVVVDVRRSPFTVFHCIFTSGTHGYQKAIWILNYFT